MDCIEYLTNRIISTQDELAVCRKYAADINYLEKQLECLIDDLGRHKNNINPGSRCGVLHDGKNED